MLTVTSLSGGKSSSMMAVEFPTDINIFSCVLTKDINAITKDKGLLREIRNKIPHFVASRELDQTLINVLKLEELLGKEIIWVASDLTYEELIARKKMLPNERTRFCTQHLKIYPMFEYCYNNGLFEKEPLLMNLGIRWDEPKRIEEMDNCSYNSIKYSFHCDLSGKHAYQHRWRQVYWRELHFPLYNHGIEKSDVIRYWDKKGWEFPTVSNCDFCFHHRWNEQQEQFEKHPERLTWWIEQESKIKARFTQDYDYQQIEKNHQLFLFQSSSSGCFCGD